MRRTTTTLLTLTAALLAAGTAAAGGILPSLNSIFKSREKASKARLMQQLQEQQHEAPAPADESNAPAVPEPSVTDYRQRMNAPVSTGRLLARPDRGAVAPPPPGALPVFIPYERLDAAVPASAFVLVPAEALARLARPEDETPAQVRPPVDAVAGEATYSLTVDATAARLDGKLTLDVLRKGYVVLPLPLGADAALEHVTLDGSPVEVGELPVTSAFTDRAVLPLVLSGTGRRTLSFRAHLPVTRRDGEMGVAFSVIPSPIAALVADVPGRHLHMDVAPGAVVGQEPGAEGRTTIRCQLTPGPRVSLRWYEETATTALTRELPAVGDDTPRPSTPPRRPPVVTAVTFTGLTVEDGRLDLEARIRFQIDHAPVDAFEVALPDDVELLSVTGPDGRPLKTWRRTAGGLEIFLPSQRQGEVAFALRGFLSLLPRIRDEGGTRRLSLTLPFAAPRRCASSSVFLGLRLARTLSPAFPDTGAFTSVTEQDLPSWIPAAERTGLHAVYKAVREAPEAGPVVDLEEERVSFPDSFRIVDAAVDTVVTTERESQTKVTYRVVNSRRQFLQVRLPEGSVFQSLFVAGAPAKAGRSGSSQTELLVPLVKSPAGSGAELRPFDVELVYTTPVAPFGVAGRLHLEALWTGATADKLRWRLGFPSQLTFSRSDGSLEQRESSSSDWNILPSTASPRSGMLRSQALGGARRDRVAMSNVMNAIREPAPTTSNRTEGAYPVRLDLPVAGGTVWFAAENVNPEGGELPWLDVLYVRGGDLDTVRGVIIILVGFSLLLTLLRLLGRQSVTLAASVLGLSLLAGLVLGLVIERGDGCVVGGLGLGLAMAMVYGIFTPIRRRIGAAALVLMSLVILTGAAVAAPVPPLEERTVRVVVPYPKDGLSKAVERYDAGGFVTSATLDEAARPTPVPTPEPKHPETVSLQSVTLDAVSDGEGRATLRLTARVTTVGPGWHRVPLIQAWAALTDVTLDGKPSPVLSVDDATVRDNERRQSSLILAALQGSSERIERTAAPVRFAVPVLGPGRHTIVASLTVDVEDRGNGWRGFTVHLPEFTERALSLKLPAPGTRVDVTAARRLTVGSPSAGTGTEAHAVLSGRSEVSARWLRPEGARRPVPAPPSPTAAAGSAPVPAPLAPPTPEGPVDPAATPVVVARLGLIASLDETHLKGSVVVDYRIERQGIEAVRLQIPAGVTIKTVHGSTHKDYQVLPHRDGIHNVLAILLRRKTTGSVTTGFDFEIPLPPAGDDPAAGRPVVVPAVRSLDTDIETGVLGVERTGNLELERVGEPTGLEKLEPTEIPESYRPLLMGRAWLVYRYRRQPWALTLSVREHPVDVGFTATVDEAVATTSLNRKGRGTTDVRLQVRNYGASFLNVELAPGVGDFKALTIDGRNENFLKLTKDRMIRIPLRKPTAERDYASTPMTIAFRFDHDAVSASDDAPLGGATELPGRRVALFFPRMNLPVTGRGLSWTVSVAPRLHIATFSGRFDEPRRPLDGLFDLFRPERGTSLALGRAFVPGSPEGFDETGRAALRLVLRVRSRGTNMALHTLAGLLAIIAGSLTLLIVVGAGRPWFRPAWPVSAFLTFLGLMGLELSSPGQQGPVIGGALASPLVALVWYVALHLRRDRTVPEGGGAPPAPDRTTSKGGDQR